MPACESLCRLGRIHGPGLSPGSGWAQGGLKARSRRCTERIQGHHRPSLIRRGGTKKISIFPNGSVLHCIFEGDVCFCWGRFAILSGLDHGLTVVDPWIPWIPRGSHSERNPVAVALWEQSAAPAMTDVKLIKSAPFSSICSSAAEAETPNYRLTSSERGEGAGSTASPHACLTLGACDV